MGYQPVARQLPTQGDTQARNEHMRTFLRGVGFEPMIPVFERGNTVIVVGNSIKSTN
jgi:hypothetical protein